MTETLPLPFPFPLVSPAERVTVARVYEFAMVLRAAGRMPDNEDEYFESPWKWDPEYQTWTECGSPSPPDLIAETAGRRAVDRNWERFVWDCSTTH